MATTNPFDLLGDVDQEDPSQLIAAAQKLAPPPQQTKKPQAPSAAAATQPAKPAKLPSKPLPPTQAVRETKNETGRGGGRGGGRGFGRGRGGGAGGYNRDSVSNESSFGNNGFSGGYRAPEEGDTGKSSERRGYGGGGGRGGYRGGRRGVGNGEAVEGERPRRTYERRSGTGRGNELKREGSGRGNWGTPTDEIAPEAEEPVIESEKTAEKPVGDEEAVDVNKESPVNEPEEKEPEDKEMTLEEYEKVLEEKRKALSALKTEERKVNLDKDLESMQQLSSKKGNDDIFIKLGSEKDKRKEAAEKEEKAKKSLSINEFLKRAEGERFYSPGGGRGRGRGRGRGSRGGFGGYAASNAAAPSIEDPGQFPTLGGAIPVVNQVMSATRGATDAFSGVSRHVNSSLKKLGAKNIEAGIGCGVGFGHGFGVGLALKPGVLNQIQFHVVQAMTKMMMRFGIVPNLPIDQGAISSSLQGGMNIINASSTQNPMGSIMQLAKKQTVDTSQGMLGHGNKTAGSIHETFMSKNTSADSPFRSHTEKVIDSFLQNPVLKGEENETNEVAGRLRSENNLLHMVVKHQQVIEELKEENEKLRQILVEELKIPLSKLQASYSSKNYSPCTDCFDCRRKQRKK